MPEQTSHHKFKRRPAWLNKKITFDLSRQTETILKELGINTVCHQAKCPNISECFQRHHATFLLLGRDCTRRCHFCHVSKAAPQPPDPNEPARVAQATARLNLSCVVITSVTRDDLSDGGAAHFASTVQAIRRRSCPSNSPHKISIELLIPDFQGRDDALTLVANSDADIIGHNLETVPRLYALRPGSDYQKSLSVLARIKKINPRMRTKSALMLGLGETAEEIKNVLKDLRNNGCDFLALGQYLRPSLHQIEVKEYILPEQFAAFKEAALTLGFAHVESGPYVRSSYHAGNYPT